MPKSPQQKQASRARILAAASRRLRAHGIEGASVAAVMEDAGLTHGGFYAHFADKAELVAAALEDAMAESRASWTAGLDRLGCDEAQRQILGRYLSRPHREELATGCPMAAMGSEIARAPEATRRAFESALSATAEALAPYLPDIGALDARGSALAIVALSVGGLTLARMVDDPDLADGILLACRRLAQAALSPPDRGR